MEFFEASIVPAISVFSGEQKVMIIPNDNPEVWDEPVVPIWLEVDHRDAAND